MKLYVYTLYTCHNYKINLRYKPTLEYVSIYVFIIVKFKLSTSLSE